MIRIGCSGFHYKEWKGVFYPADLPSKDWFGYYCRHFNTIEINSSFYGLPTVKTMDNWYHTSSDDFLFTIKAPAKITHEAKFSDTEELISNFYQTIASGLKEKLGCVLFQLPPSFTYTADRLSLILKNLSQAFHNVVEFRHISWWNNDVFTEFKNKNVTFSGLSYPSALPDQVIQFTNPVYYRFHGKPVLYKSLYTAEEISKFASVIVPVNKQVFVYFNNTWGTAALTNAAQLIELLNGRTGFCNKTTFLRLNGN